ncbi:MAG: glycosyl hydrolase [Bacteroidetes bacterium]|nr:glycosyl hydrolase [Bacteroidota bacterium]
MKSYFYLAALCLCHFQFCFAQSQSSDRLSSFQEIKSAKSPFQQVAFRNIGPSIMSGRVTDIEVNPKNTNEFYVAYASGGVWHTLNNGLSFTPIFDDEATHTIGDMAMDWNSHTLWVGTGEVNSSRSSYAGTGMYSTKDSGKTWQHQGLPESHHIGKIIVHPSNSKIIWVAVLGHLYTKNNERGIFKTEDGGKTWRQTLFVNDSTGCVDMVIDPKNPDHLFCSAWNRTRKAWSFNGSGEGSAIYKSIDGGEHWTINTNGKNGFPVGKGVGRIGLSICQNNPQVMYALLDNQFNQEEKKDEEKKMDARELETMSKEIFLALDDSKLETYLRDQGYPEKYTAKATKEEVRKNTYTVKDIADWKLADADANLFNTPVIGAELYRSNDGGISWQKTHSDILEGVYFTYGYYFGTVAVSPSNPDKVYIAGYPILMSDDGGKSFTSKDGENCHPDYHRIWINPSNDQHIITGNDGGVNISYDGGDHWYKANNPPVGQFYAVQVDDAKPYNVYGGLQDNGTWTASSTTVENTGWHQGGQNPYKNIGDGDGMQVQVDSRDNATVYVGYQFGNYYKINKNTGDNIDVKPVHDIGENPYRFNWQTPILLSKHHEDIFYIGSNCLHRSLHQGKDLKTISKDLTANKSDQKGNIPFSTLTTLSESSLKYGLLYTGSDDGIISCSKDAGFSWTRISNPLPQNLWVSRVIASKHKEERVYATLNAYRNDDFTAYVFMSDDYGKNWKQLGKNLAAEPVNVMREDPKNEDILYVGTDNGLYISFDRGENFMAWDGELPRVAIHDMVIQERENELVLGTHGRSIYIAKLDLIQQYPKYKSQSLVIMPLDSIWHNERWGKKTSAYSEAFEPELSITYFTQAEGIHTFRILNKKGAVLQSFTDTAVYGYNTTSYNLSLLSSKANTYKPAIKKAENEKYYLAVGEYKIEIENSKGIKENAVFKIQAKKAD